MLESAASVEVGSGRRRYWTVEEKRKIVEQTLSSSKSVATVARHNGVNANQVFYWRKLYHAGQLVVQEHSGEPNVRLLAVSVAEGKGSVAGVKRSDSATSGVTMHIEIVGRALVSLEGAVDAAMVCAVLESLRG
jgi:transposase